MDAKPKKIKIARVKKLVQIFPEKCIYSCSKSGEVRNFVLTREYYQITVLGKKFKFLEQVRIVCDNCGWKAKMPGNFAKKIFKKGLQSHLLLKYAKNPVVTSRILNLWGSLWRVWLATFAVLGIITVVSFYNNPIVITTPQEISMADALTSKYLGKVVTIKGKVDYSQALERTVYYKYNRDRVLSNEVYMPIFNNIGDLDFVLLQGGQSDWEKVRSRAGITNLDLLRNQDYTVTGKLQSISTLKNAELRSFFIEELPKSKNYNAPKLVVNSVNVEPIGKFAESFEAYYILSLVLLITSAAIQIYIDKKLA